MTSAPKKIMHMMFSGSHASPFDINMAVDAGYEVIVPHTNVATSDVTALVQDAIFSRPPGYFQHTGCFFGGGDINQACDMLDAASAAMVPPFEVSVFADPNGAFTTSAAMVARVVAHLQKKESSHHAMVDKRVHVYGGGPVGLCAAVLAAKCGATPVLCRLTPARADKTEAIAQFLNRFDVDAEFADAETVEARASTLKQADIALVTAKAGVQVLDANMLLQANKLQVAADVNAVPPTGVEGLTVSDNSVPIGDGSCVGFGALAIGNIKYRTQQSMLESMLNTDSVCSLDFHSAFETAKVIAGCD